MSLAPFFGERSGGARSGSLSEELFEPLMREALGELNRPFEVHQARRALAFCEPGEIIYPESAQESAQLWESGATVVIQRLSETNQLIRELCESATQALGKEVLCSVYLSRRGGISFSWHKDMWSVFVVQVHGSKTFHVCRSEDELAAAAKGERFPLEPGAWLRIDPEEPHMATSEAEYSVHLSFGAHDDK